MTMTSHRAYLVRALYEWILDNDCTPYVLVNALADDVQVPQEYVKDGQIVLNIAPAAVHGLLIDNEALSCNGRFGGIPMLVYVPAEAIMGIYARENGQGMMFDTEAAPAARAKSPKPGKPKGVKVTERPSSEAETEGPDDDGSDPKGGGKRRPPTLRVVK